MAKPAQIDALRNQNRLELESSEQETIFHLELTEADAMDLASGFVPMAIRAACIAGLDWERDDQRRALRPVKSPILKAGAKTPTRSHK